MAYVQSLGAIWLDDDTGTTPCGPTSYRPGPPIRTSDGRTITQKCWTVPGPTDTVIPLSKLDRTKYDIIQSLNSGSQLVTKGGTWEGEFKAVNAAGTGVEVIKPVADPTTGVYIPPGFNTPRADPYKGQTVVAATSEVRRSAYNPMVPEGQVTTNTGGTAGGGTYVDPRTGKDAVLATGGGMSPLMLVGIAGALGLGAYLFIKRRKGQ